MSLFLADLVTLGRMQKIAPQTPPQTFRIPLSAHVRLQAHAHLLPRRVLCLQSSLQKVHVLGEAAEQEVRGVRAVNLMPGSRTQS
jgi:hypothetical protein